MIFNKSKFNEHWNTQVLSDLGTFQRGKSRHRPRNDKALFENGNHPLVQTGEVKAANLHIWSHTNTYNDFGLAQSKKWPKGTLAITIAANIAETALLGYPMCFPDSVVGFQAHKECSSEIYMHYVFTYIRAAIQNSVSGSIQDNINIDYLTSLEFKVPNKPEQDKIAKVLSTLDAKIELNNRINGELEAMAKLLYDYWFVQFDFPMTAAQATALGQPELEGQPYKTSGGKMVFNQTLKRNIPEGWEVKSLEQVEDQIITGKTPPTTDPENFGGDIPFICIGDVRGNMHVVETELTLSTTGADLQKKKFIPKGSICVTCIASPGLIAFATKDSQTNQQLNSIVCRNDVNRMFLYFYLSDYFKYASGAKTGNTFANMNKGDFSAINVLLPNQGLLTQFMGKVSSSESQILTNQKQNQELTELRDWLLPMLMNGQVTVEG